MKCPAVVKSALRIFDLGGLNVRTGVTIRVINVPVWSCETPRQKAGHAFVVLDRVSS